MSGSFLFMQRIITDKPYDLCQYGITEAYDQFVMMPIFLEMDVKR